MKKHFGIQEEGDPDFFFDVSQETQQEQQDELLPAAIDSELSGENHGSTSNELLPAAIDSELSGENHGSTSDLLTALSGVVDIDDNNDTVPKMSRLQLQLPLSFPIHGDMQGFVSESSRVLETLQQSCSSLLT